MATVILVRHGRTTANAAGVLAGRADGIRLDEVGIGQATRTAERLSAVSLAAIISSPLERCQQTAGLIVNRQAKRPAVETDAQISEVDYGQWQGRALRDLAREPLWSVVQTQPSAAAFPGGETLAGMQTRSVAAIRRHDAAIEAQHGPDAVWVAVSHGDVIKSVLADALGMHLDLFQRIRVAPASVSIISYGTNRPTVHATNTDSGDLEWLTTKSPPSDATPGGGS